MHIGNNMVLGHLKTKIYHLKDFQPSFFAFFAAKVLKRFIYILAPNFCLYFLSYTSSSQVFATLHPTKIALIKATKTLRPLYLILSPHLTLSLSSILHSL